MILTTLHMSIPGTHVYVRESRRKMIYVREADEPVWRRASKFARNRRLTMSALIMTALEYYLARHATAADDD